MQSKKIYRRKNNTIQNVTLNKKHWNSCLDKQTYYHGWRQKICLRCSLKQEFLVIFLIFQALFLNVDAVQMAFPKQLDN